MDEVLAAAGCSRGAPEAAEVHRRAVRRIDVPRGAVVFNEGEPGDSLYIVLSGKIKLGRRAADGRQNLVAVMGPSDMFGELSLFDPGPRTATATAVTDARLARLPKQALRPWLTNRPEIAEQLLRVLARRLRRTNAMLADLIFTDVPGRVAKNLLQMAAASARWAASCGSPTTSPRRSWPSWSAPPGRPSTRRWPTSPTAAGCGWTARP